MNATRAWIDGRITIPDLLQAAPAVRPILNRYGFCGSGSGRLASLRSFARAQDVPLPRLLDELRAACDLAGTPEDFQEGDPGCPHWAGRLHW